MNLSQQITWILALAALAQLLFKAVGEHHRGKVYLTKPVVINIILLVVAVFIAY